MNCRWRFLQIAVFVPILFLTVSSCSLNTEGDDTKRISGTAYSKMSDGSTVNWYTDVKHAYTLNEDGTVTISYGSESGENEHIATLDLSGITGISADNVGFYISEDKTAVAYGGASKSVPVTVAISDDMGQTWYRTDIDSGDMATGSKYVSFATVDAGWLIVSEPTDTGNERHHIYATSDGGKHWQYVESNLNKQFNGTLTGAGFTSEKVGAVGFSSKTAFEPGACFTNDGGHNWYRLYITVPQEYSSYTKTALSPILDGKTIVMPIILSNEEGDVKTFYMQSENFGKTWYNESSRKIRMSVDVNEYCDI